jgi:lysophospholipid acyltransferase (LPLAT)-like uncharacterized protein
LSFVLRLWWRSVKVEMGPSDLAAVTQRGRPIVFVIWHNRLFMTPDFVRRYRGGHPIYGLVSASKDGDWLAALFASVGLGAIRGSSSRRGREAATLVVDALGSGHDVGITPDGPRGPVYVLKPGALVVGRRTDACVVLVGTDFESAWRVPSWDGFYLPKPFSRIKMRFQVTDVREIGETEEGCRELARQLSELNPDRIPARLRRKA